MKENMQIVFGLLGGLAVFIYGMNLMSESLQKAAGEKMKSILALLTKNRIMGVIAGALVTAVLQSSSATTVMAIGFVSAGLMSLPQAISIIFGANIGTTMTAQIIAFKITDYIYAFIFIGFILTFVCKSERIKSIGQTIFAFGLLFLGIETMGDVMKPLASSPVFTDLIGKVSGIPVLGLLLGTVMTLVVQSSSATIAVLQNFAAQPGVDGVTSILGLVGAIPILLGDNIGTTITALLASLGQSRDAKRTAIAHTIFNLSGSLVFIWFVKPYAALIQAISPKGPEVEVISRQIANAHTLFNLTMTVVWVCLLGLMVKIVMWLIPDAKDAKVNPLQPAFLDKKVIGQPTAALKLVAKEVLHCSGMVKNMLKDLAGLSKSEDPALVGKIKEQGQTLHSLMETINDYLAELFSAGVLTELQATQTAKLMHVCGDVERMGELAADLTDVIAGKIELKYSFSEEAMEDLRKSLNQISKMYGDAMRALEQGEPEEPEKLIRRREKVMNLDINMRKAHMDRVNKGKCKAKLSAPFTRLLHCVDRMGNSCVNLADMAMEHMNFGYFLDMEDDR
ncbi:MAG: Na/Pi cotransporter family protein [Clostridiaceae bacterium]|nr:Na/Pi cotransporter family protein [Clostridiaceae bacterium]MDY4545953.1 Na/Pi cotransporter family protein [Candidatus Choladocola sp.]